MVTVFNPQALGDPGPTAASGIIGAGLSSATGLIANRKNNQIELLKQLLGTGGTMLGNELERRSEAEQGRAGLKVLKDMNMLPKQMQNVNLEKINIDPTTVNTIIAAQNPNRFYSQLNTRANLGKTLSQGGIDVGNVVLEDAAQAYADRQSTGSGIQQPGTATQQFTMQDGTEQPVQQSQSGTFQLGAQDQTATGGNLFRQKSEEELTSQQMENRKKQIELNRQEKRYQQQKSYEQGPAIEPNLMSYSSKQPIAYRIGDRVLPNSEEATGARMSYQEIKNELAPAQAAKRITDFETKAKRVTKLINLLSEGEKLVGSNFYQTLANQISADPNVLMVTNDPRAAIIKQIVDEINGIVALQVTVDVQGTRPTDIDVTKVLTALPNMLKSKAAWKAGVKSIVGDVGAGALDDAVVLDRPGFVMRVGPLVEKLTNNKYEFGTNMGIGSSNEPLTGAAMPMDTESVKKRQATFGNMTTTAPQKSVARPAAKTTARPAQSLDDELNIMLNEYNTRKGKR